MYFIRVDLDRKSGLGHYYRILSILKYLKIKNYKIVTSYLSKNSFFDLNKKNILNLYSHEKRNLSEIVDAKLFLKLIKDKKKTIVIKDSYKLNYNWERQVKKKIKKLVVISDDIHSKHFSDFYINHNPELLNLNNIHRKILKQNNKKNCNFLLGPKFAMFNASLDKKKLIKTDVLFYNGGSGNVFVYKKIIDHLIKKTNLRIGLIIGPFCNIKKYANEYKNSKRLKILIQPNNILPYIKSTKLFISPAGISMFESSFLKTPSLLFRMNSNQNLNDSEYEKLGHYFILDKFDLRFTKKISELILNLYKNINDLKKLFNGSSINLKNIKKNYVRELLFKLK